MDKLIKKLKFWFIQKVGRVLTETPDVPMATGTVSMSAKTIDSVVENCTENVSQKDWEE